jgi:hypothetical protein
MNKTKKTAPEFPPERAAAVDSWGRATCPYCGAPKQDTRNGEGICMICGRVFNV